MVFHDWFPFMFRLSVTPLPKMSSELKSHDPWDCCLFLFFGLCYVLPGTMCYVLCVLRGAVVRDAWYLVRFHALLRPLNCGP